MTVKEIKQFYRQIKTNSSLNIKEAQFKIQIKQLSVHLHMILYRLKEKISIIILNREMKSKTIFRKIQNKYHH
jgi:hypothetical protein